MKRLILAILHTMKFCMCRFAREQHKVINGVIYFISVDMMNNLGFKKVSTKMLFHDKAMFKDIVVFWREWMVHCFNKNISILCNSSAFPRWAILKRKSSFSVLSSTFTRTIYSSICIFFCGIKRVLAQRTNFYNSRLYSGNCPASYRTELRCFISSGKIFFTNFAGMTKKSLACFQG